MNRNYAIVDEVKQTVFQGEVYKGRDIGTATIFQDDVRISTNVHNEDGSRAIGTRIAADVYQQVVVKGEQYLGRAFVVNNWYITAYEPIKDYENKIIGILYVGILEQKYTDIRNQAILVFSGITLTGVALSILIALLISRSISSSIKRLATASKQLASGNLEAKVTNISNDELGELAKTFNFMATALKDRDEQLKEFTKKKIMESERLALIGQLSANVAHELNNPLQGIVTYSYLLLEEETCTEDAKENLQKIVVQANRCRDIIRGLLDFSRQKKPDKTLCNVNALLQGCISLVEKQALFHNIKVVLKLEENPPMVILDPSQVERVFLNLIINAAEAMDGIGTLTLTTKHNRKKKTIEIKVQDTGHGISKENMSKVFDPFFTTKETGHGVGLGLAITYGIVKEHNGTITVESELEKGTTFISEFPFEYLYAWHRQMETKSKILIIDDEEVVLDSCTQILKGGSYQIATAPDGKQGLKLLQEFLPDLVFVDLKMPGISGFEVLEKIHEFDTTIVTVVITGFATVSSAVDAMKKGAYDFLPKPFTPDEFRLITRRSIERRRLVLEAISLRREKELLREQFASIVSHELKAPLSAVQQNLFALEFELSNLLNESQKEKLERIKTRIDELLKLINSWLRVISVDVEKLKEGFTQIDITTPIRNALESIETLATRKDIEVVTSFDPQLPQVNGDALSLSEVFVNIIGNAIKYSPNGSKVHLKTERQGNKILVSVKDNGIGISPEDLPHIFEGFYRGQSGKATAGHGIGLAVSRQIVDAHDGSITVDSELGKGTTFVIVLPVSNT